MKQRETKTFFKKVLEGQFQTETLTLNKCCVLETHTRTHTHIDPTYMCHLCNMSQNRNLAPRSKLTFRQNNTSHKVHLQMYKFFQGYGVHNTMQTHPVTLLFLLNISFTHKSPEGVNERIWKPQGSIFIAHSIFLVTLRAQLQH